MTLQSRKGSAAIDFSLSNEVLELFNAAAVRNINEATTVLLHVSLLETGFIPKDMSHADIYKVMPEDWNAKGIFKIKYLHYCCPSFTCCVTCVPLYNNVSVHGIICDTVSSESVDLKMNISKYIKQKKDLSNVAEVFCTADELLRFFKDHFCLPFLNRIHETAGGKLYGFPGLYDDAKILILTLLPVKSILAMSSVNKNLHNVTNLPFLWKYLFERDFSKDGKEPPELVVASTKTDWKELYKKEYIKRNRKPEKWNHRFHYRHLPRIINLPPDLDSDFGFDFDPPFPNFLPPFIHPHSPPYLRPPALPEPFRDFFYS